MKHSFAPQFIYFYVVREIQLSIVPAFSLLVFSYLFSAKADDLQQDDAATVVAKWAGRAIKISYNHYPSLLVPHFHSQTCCENCGFIFPSINQIYLIMNINN